MAELFSTKWAMLYQQAWNDDKQIQEALGTSNFSSVVAFGFPNVDDAAFIMSISSGLMVEVNSNKLSEVQWDIRATKENWISLIVKPPGLMRLGIAYTARKIRFRKGDYANMIKDPHLATAFVKSFALMGKIL